jgi:colicin import membrane protein
MFSKEWILPLNFAVGLHILILLTGLYLPGLFKASPKFAEIHTVRIIDIADPVAAPKPQQTTPAAKEEKPPVSAKKPISTAQNIQTAPPAPPAKPVSIKPLKKKIVHQQVTKKPEPKPQPDAAKQQREDLAKSIREAELLEKKAQLAKEALDRERALLKTVPATQVSSATTAEQNDRNRQAEKSGIATVIEGQYIASIINRIHQFWALPVSLEKKTDLTAVVVVKISNSGQITEMYFENRSGDRLFDQFVNQTLEAAIPLPPMPAAMKKPEFELGLVFKPGGIQ